ncbi:MAG: phosphoribosylformylglycinamidine synthase subunit PurL [Nitrososphaerota archaeon]|nr:phosphoribosylformylglycinamidine synthase subunit PurL [Nitrososphaerota archaeon]
MAVVRRSLGREPNETEWSIIDAEWSEHSSYKSSRGLLKLFPTTGPRVVLGPGYDAGVVDVGDGHVVTLHIESHNHPSAVDPYGGASTGIGGVLRDILSVASRPIALVDILRFGDIEKSGHSRWLLKNVVRGIADYGNCLSEDETVCFADSGGVRVGTALELVEGLAAAGRLAGEFREGGLVISKPLGGLRMLSFDFASSEAQFRRVSRVYEAKATTMVKIRTDSGGQILVTPDHPMFLLRDGEVETTEAKSLKEGDSLPLARDFPYPREAPAPEGIDLVDELGKKGAADGIAVTTRGNTLREFKDELDPLLRRAGVSASQRSRYFRTNRIPLETLLSVESTSTLRLPRDKLLLCARRGGATTVPAAVDLDDDLSRLVGYYLSGGRVGRGAGKAAAGGALKVTWTFGSDELEHVQRVCSILERLSIRHSTRLEAGSSFVEVSSTALARFFTHVLEAGLDRYTKKIPSVFYERPIGLSIEVLKGIVRGDGRLTTGASRSLEVRFGSASPTLFQQVLLLLHALGHVPSCSAPSRAGSEAWFSELSVAGGAMAEAPKEVPPIGLVVGAGARSALHVPSSTERRRGISMERLAAVKVSSLEVVEGDFRVFNFEVEGTHNYITSGGIVTHNCTGIPTVAGEVEFDGSFERNCLVDVACVGVGRKGLLILGEAKAPGDVLVLIGGSTGRDGIKGATFASKNLKEDAASERSSVQVPDPFMKKLLLDSLLEAIENRADIRGMKDLGGGGLSTALSEVASKGGTGVDVELKRVRLREDDMSPTEVMTSESQERMLLVLPPDGGRDVLSVLEKYDVPYSVIGKVTSTPNLVLRWGGRVVADLPASLVTEAPLIPWPSRAPRSKPSGKRAGPPPALGDALLGVLASPNVASKRWVYQQYDHEVGVRTVVKPGQADAAVMRLPNGRFLAIKGDGNSRQVALDPYAGAAGCVAEACRNVVSVGAEPIAMLDHLQSGDPSDPEVYWAFRENLRGMADYCKAFGLPVVGGKVSFYNEDTATGRAIKPSPIALVVGLAADEKALKTTGFKREGDSVLLVGETRPELAGSELCSRFPTVAPTARPAVDPGSDLRTCNAVLALTRSGLVDAVHDCSSGGLAVALAEMAMAGGLGASVDLSRVAGAYGGPLEAAFSESHGRFVVSASDPSGVSDALRRAGVAGAVVGRVGGAALELSAAGRRAARVPVASMLSTWEGAIPRLMD